MQRRSWQHGRKNNLIRTPTFALCQYSKLTTGITSSIATYPKTSGFHIPDDNFSTPITTSSHRSALLMRTSTLERG
ncbi:unnamed protein product [Mycena citricolor]|uniref:Uncharacterized protein n=1 Tax=Mycena citricolor TaxID=2018698 RepID=A0AAD2GXF2_9AGAR|nr:unnamed protein product [Mycena citricolor]